MKNRLCRNPRRHSLARISQVVFSPSGEAAISEFREGWSVVLVCFCVATFAWGFGFMANRCFSPSCTRARLADLADRIGDHGELLTGAVLLTCVHRVIEVLGPRLLLAGGTAIMAVSAIGMSHVQAPWQLYLCGIVMAVGWAAPPPRRSR
jgi:hypothetical protein